MALGRYMMEDENSVVVQAARRVVLTDDVTVTCKTSEDAEALRAYLASLSEAPAKRAARRSQV